MKISINKSAKRGLSLVLAFAMLIGCLFTANVGVTIIAGAETAPIEEGTIDLLEFGDYLVNDLGSTSKWYDTKLADNGETGADWDNAIIIDSAEELVYLCKGSGDDTDGKYYKVADGIAGFNLATDKLDVNGTLTGASLADGKTNLDIVKGSGKNHSGGTPGFQGHFDGNGATVYGAWTNHESISAYTGLFSCVKGDVTIKNIHVKLASFTATTGAGGIVGYYMGEGNYTNNTTLTIEKCSVTDSHIEVTGANDGSGIGAIVGRVNVPSGYTDKNDEDGDGNTTETLWVNNQINVTNCFVNLDDTYFISPYEDNLVESKTHHGGAVAYAGTNAVMVSNCIIIGIQPYPATKNTAGNQIQHTGHPNNFSNVYTDQAITNNTYVGGTTNNGYQDLTGVIHQLTPAQMQGDEAAANMNLAWLAVWKPGAEGEYPTFVKDGEEMGVSFWSGAAASEFAGGDGTKENPFIIKTADQLYRALSTITDATNNVAGGKQTSQILKQGSTTEYVPVYTPYYYKVDDSVEALYLGNIYGKETKEGIHTAATTNKLTEWKPGKSFVGYLDGNGVTIYGMYSKSGEGLVYKLDGSATVKNISFEACYTIRSMLTMNLGTYSNDSTLINVSNISVRNSCLHGNTNFWIKANNSNELAQNQPGPSLISTSSTCENLTITNCLFDGLSCDVTYGDLYYDDNDGDSTNNPVLVSSDEEMRKMIGGIISGGSSMNNVSVNGSVSLGSPIVDEAYAPGYEVVYTRYDKNQGFQVYFYNSYSDVPSNVATAYPGKYDKLLNIDRIEAKDAYAIYDMPKLNWRQWALVTADGRTVPMPTVNTADEVIGSYVEVAGKGQNNYAGVGPYASGDNPYTYKLKGAGTEENPYIIENGEQLARAIATGGMNLYDRLYYKLGCDIDISDGSWINQEERAAGGIYYTYKEFGGTLDGDGHVITGLSSGDSKAAGLIPVLASGGVVKNLHVRDANVVSSTAAGVIVGDQQAGSTITGCSAEGSTVSMPNGGYHIMGNVAGAFNTLYFITADGKYLYVDESSNLYGDYVADLGDIDTFINNKVKQENSAWYIGGKEGSMPRLANLNSHANDLDIVGDGKADSYGAGDLSALKNKLLKKSAYNYINGDVSRNGIINIADLAMLQRAMVDDGAVLSDSFFSNVEAGQIKIYYGENDNYDAARKVELYLESLFPGVDVQKCVSTTKGTVTGANSDASKVYLHAGDKAENPDGKLDVIIGDVVGYAAESSMADNTYEVTYDSANKVVWLKGKNFTAVEQAAINFTNGCAVDGDVVYTCGATVLSDEKKPVTVMLDTNFDGTPDTNKTLYYAWGDEFEEDTLNTYNWTHNTQQSEGSNGSDGSYNNQEIAPVKDLGKVITITNGRLSMKRGHDSSLGGDVSYTTSEDNTIVGSVALDVEPGEFNGYRQDGVNAIDTDGSDKYFSSGKIVTDRGMLYKQGYIEFQGQLPADGHAFPAWWLMGRPSQSATNHGYDNSLYGKVYKLNENWDGVSDSWDESNLDTFKYQIPSAIYEIDMIEVMQHSDRHYSATGDNDWGINLGGTYHSSYSNVYKNSTTAVNMYFLNTTIHKWWNNGVDTQDTPDTSDDILCIADWDNYQVVGNITNSAFKTTSSAGSWIHNIGSTKYDFGSPTLQRLGKYYYNTGSFNQTAHDNLTQTRRYGFSWNTNGTGFEATLYIYNEDGSLMNTVPIASGMSDYAAFKDGDKNTEANGAIGSNAGIYSDAKVFNQYMYILFDNKYYSSNDNTVTNGSALQFTDLLTCAGLKSFEIDYVRVYQEDGFRDIVTQETQAFNNNNHFGYN